MAKPTANPSSSSKELDELLGGSGNTPQDPVQQTTEFSAPTTENSSVPTEEVTEEVSAKKKSKSSSDDKQENAFIGTLLAESKKRTSSALQKAKSIFTKKSRILGYVCGTDAKIDFSLRSASTGQQNSVSVKEIFLKNTPPTKIESFIIKYPNSLYNLIQKDGKNIAMGEMENSYNSVDDIIAVMPSDRLPEFYRCYTNKALIEDESIFVEFTRGGNNKITFSHWGTKPEELIPQEVQAYGDLGHPYVSMKTDFYGYIQDPDGAVDANGQIKLKKVNMKTVDPSAPTTEFDKNKGIVPSYKYISCYRGTRLQAPGNYIPLKRFATKNFAVDTETYTDNDAVAYTTAYLKSVWTRLDRADSNGVKKNSLSAAQANYFPNVISNPNAIATAFNPDPKVRQTYWNSNDTSIKPPVEHWYKKDAQGNKIRLTLEELNIVSRDISDNNKPKVIQLSNSNVSAFVPVALQPLFTSKDDKVPQLEVATLKTTVSNGRGRSSSQSDYSENLTDEDLNKFLSGWLSSSEEKSINY